MEGLDLHVSELFKGELAFLIGEKDGFFIGCSPFVYRVLERPL